MLHSKNKLARKAATAEAAAVVRSRAKQLRKAARQHGNNATTTTAATTPSSSSSLFASAVMTRDDVLAAETAQALPSSTRSRLIRDIGDDINTRLRDVVAEERRAREEQKQRRRQRHDDDGDAAQAEYVSDNNNDDDDDDDLLDPDALAERKRALLEEARLAAGTQQRVVSTTIAEYFAQQQQTEGDARNARDDTGSSAAAAADVTTHAVVQLVRVHHNSNAVTAVDHLGDELVVFGDKAGKAYVAYLTPRAAQQYSGNDNNDSGDKKGTARKVLLSPTLPAAVCSVAVSDTRHARPPTTRELLEKTTVDMSCSSYTAVGTVGGAIGIWRTATRAFVGLLSMHHGAVTGLCFRQHTATLYSCSRDHTLRVWSVPQMLCADKLFGHTSAVNDVHALRRDTCASVGDDGTMRVWRVEAATQQAYEYLLYYREEALAQQQQQHEQQQQQQHQQLPAPPAKDAKRRDRCPLALSCVSMLSDTVVVAGAHDGSLVVFDVHRRKPLVVLPAAHGYGSVGDGTGLEKAAVQQHAHAEATATMAAVHSDASRQRRNANPITAVATVSYADVAASASYDGAVRLWRCEGMGNNKPANNSSNNGNTTTTRTRQPPQLLPLALLPMHALVTSLRFASGGDVLFVACSKEPREGRWVVQRSAQNSVCVVPLTASAASAMLTRDAADVAHCPAQLYGIVQQQHDDDDDDGSDNSDDVADEVAEGRQQQATAEDDDSSAALKQDDDDVDDTTQVLRVGADGQMLLSEQLLLPRTPQHGNDDNTQHVRTGKRKTKKAVRKTSAKATSKKKKKLKAAAA